MNYFKMFYDTANTIHYFDKKFMSYLNNSKNFTKFRQKYFNKPITTDKQLYEIFSKLSKTKWIYEEYEKYVKENGVFDYKLLADELAEKLHLNDKKFKQYVVNHPTEEFLEISRLFQPPFDEETRYNLLLRISKTEWIYELYDEYKKRGN